MPQSERLRVSTSRKMSRYPTRIKAPEDTFGGFLTMLRGIRGMNRSSVAVETGITPSTLKNIELNIHPPTVRHLNSLMDALDFTPETPEEIARNHPPTQDTFGDFLYQRREDLGLSRRELAKLVGVSHQFMSKLESNESLPGAAYLESLMDVLGFTPECPEQIATNRGRRCRDAEAA